MLLLEPEPTTIPARPCQVADIGRVRTVPMPGTMIPVTTSEDRRVNDRVLVVGLLRWRASHSDRYSIHTRSSTTVGVDRLHAPPNWTPGQQAYYRHISGVPGTGCRNG